MSLTLVEANKLSQDVLLKGVIEIIIKDSPILAQLPFIEVVGNGLSYNRENVLPSVGFYAVGDTWAESTPTFTSATAQLTILGGDADVDNFLKITRSNVQDIEAEVIALKTKALRHKFEETFLYGTTATANQFEGLRTLINTWTSSDQVIAVSATGSALTLEKLDELVDKVLGGKPDALVMSRRSRRKINSLVRALGSVSIEMKQTEFGLWIEYYNGIPLWVTDWQLDTHTCSASLDTAITGGTTSNIYAVQVGEGALAGITAPGAIVIEPVGQLETKDATRTRIKWYCGLALFSSKKAAALVGVTN